MSSAGELEELHARAAEAEARAHAGDFRTAAKELRALVERYGEVAGADDPGTLTVRLNLARVLGAAKQSAKAIAVCEPLLRDQERVLGPDHEDVLETRQLLANLRYATGDTGGAAADLEQLLAALSRVLMPTHDRITKVKRDIEFLKRSC
ncbi:tetratricopeptide repeat protein [Lentzea jiangxiensis]|uniref:Tetratricopeptide repeat-containing protein n=1 Tax=Lentzea jiangxiensis TaxID=641025 RepID=A0A1H0G2G5_9PSEU|nr:tetratricopeptide repeat protein [Lentzea jiangxiensis]SDO00919.1 Tetratricopeptide repeat-containing protein [Lentzea jiangxiensis]